MVTHMEQIPPLTGLDEPEDPAYQDSISSPAHVIISDFEGTDASGIPVHKAN